MNTDVMDTDVTDICRQFDKTVITSEASEFFIFDIELVNKNIVEFFKTNKHFSLDINQLLMNSGHNWHNGYTISSSDYNWFLNNKNRLMLNILSEIGECHTSGAFNDLLSMYDNIADIFNLYILNHE